MDRDAFKRKRQKESVYHDSLVLYAAGEALGLGFKAKSPLLQFCR